MRNGYPTSTQRDNCLRLADELSSLSQNAYSKLYRDNLMHYLVSETTDFSRSVMRQWHDSKGESSYEFGQVMDDVFFDAIDLFYSQHKSRDAVVSHLRLVANLPQPPKTLLTRCGAWVDDKFSFLLQADP